MKFIVRCIYAHDWETDDPIDYMLTPDGGVSYIKLFNTSAVYASAHVRPMVTIPWHQVKEIVQTTP